MKPILKSEMRRVEWWSCTDPYHRHIREDVAARCIAKMTASRKNPKRPKERLAQLLAEHRGGKRQCDLARQLGLSPERVRQMLAQAVRLEQVAVHANQLDNLSVRSRNCLRSIGIDTIDHARQAMLNGQLENVPNLGKVSKREVLALLDSIYGKEAK